MVQMLFVKYCLAMVLMRLNSHDMSQFSISGRHPYEVFQAHIGPHTKLTLKV
jgi:hypothetical protein